MLSFGSPGSTKSQTRDLNFKLIVLEKHPGVAINLCVASHHPFQFPWSEIEDTMATHHVFVGAKNFRTLGFLGSSDLQSHPGGWKMMFLLDVWVIFG